jgi:hypothetical protein
MHFAILWMMEIFRKTFISLMAGGKLMKALNFTTLFLVLVLITGAYGQSPDSFIVENVNSLPGDTVSISIYMHNTQFSVAGFTMRFVLQDSAFTHFIGASRGAAVFDFDYFNVILNDGTIRVSGIADLPGGGSPPLLSPGIHEMVNVAVVIDELAPGGESDSIIFMDDSLPPDRDNSISDSTGYINEVPTLIGGVILFDTQSGIDDPVELPSRVELFQNYPNPFNAKTRISFILAQEEKNVKLNIYDVMGRRVNGFFWDYLLAGEHYVIWNGKNDSGELLTSGIYFYRLVLSGLLAEGKSMTLLK